ncbi:MAG: UMP kinase [Candidatus Micrarchaeota archaeon]
MIIFSVGGSLINPGKPDEKFLKGLSKLLIRIHSKKGVAIVTGGGAPARTYANAIRSLGGPESASDSAAILSTRQNALLLITALGKHAWPSVPTSFEEASCGVASGRIVVMGGTIPAITTDTDAAILAELLGAERIVNVSNVDGIYTGDPKRDHKAKKLDKLKFSQLISIAMQGDRRIAGENFVFDLFACKIIARSKIETHFVGSKSEDIEHAALGKHHSGTVVKVD